MAKAKIKIDPKDFLLRKGEFVVMGAAGLCLLVLLIWGASKFASAEDPNKTARDLAERAYGVKAKIDDKGEPSKEEKEAIEAAEFITKPQMNKPASTRDFPASGPVFDPVAQPSTKRDNPIVFNVEDYQVDLIRAAMPGFDIVTGDRGPEIAMIATKVKGEQDKERLKELSKRLGAVGKRPRPGPPAQPKPAPGPGGDSGAYAGSPYGTSGGAYDANARREDRVLTYELLGDYDKKVGEGLVPAITVIPVRLVTIHAVVPYKKQLQEFSRALRKPIPAPVYAINPQTGKREITPASAAEIAAAEAELQAMLFYDGFEVQRREVRYDASGKDMGKWAPLPQNPKSTEGNYKFEEKYIEKIDTRKIGDHIDEGYLPYFLKPEMMLSMPLPLLAPELKVKYRVRYEPKGATSDEQKEIKDREKYNEELKKLNEERRKQNKPPLPLLPNDYHEDYPGLRLKPILDNIRKLETANRDLVKASEALQRLQGSRPKSSLYMPQGNALSGTGLDGAGAGFGGVPMPKGGPGKGPGGVPMPMGGPGPMGVPGGPMGTAGGVPLEVENFLLRFVDADVEQGRTYEYRIRLRMRNPNFGMKDEVAQEAFAGKEYEILYSKWRTLNTPITIPAESFLYAQDTKEYRDKTVEALKDARDQEALLRMYQIVKDGRGDYVFRDGLAVVQMATWMEAVRTDQSGRREPIGSWVVTEVPVGRGEYVGRKQYVRLPLWSSEKRSYVFREVAEKLPAPRGSKSKTIELPKGWLVDFSTNSVLVGFEGGRVKTASRVSFDKDGNLVLNSNPNTITEDVYADLLILRGQDNRVVVRSARLDGRDEIRKSILDSWTGWVTQVKEDTTTSDPGMKGLFDPKGGKRP